MISTFLCIYTCYFNFGGGGGGGQSIMFLLMLTSHG